MHICTSVYVCVSIYIHSNLLQRHICIYLHWHPPPPPFLLLIPLVTPEGRIVVQEAVTGHLCVQNCLFYGCRAHLIYCPLRHTLECYDTHTHTHAQTSNQLVLRFIQPGKLGGVSLPKANQIGLSRDFYTSQMTLISCVCVHVYVCLRLTLISMASAPTSSGPFPV